MERYFELKARKTSVAIELRGAVATFLTMSYIIFANPAILGAAGLPFGAVAAATALAAGVCCLMMGLTANFPLALASGMGLNSVIAFQVTAATGSWQTAMGLVVLDGLFVFLLVMAGLREAVMHAIPRDLKVAIGAGIGIFIALIGLVNAKMVVVPQGTLAVLAKDPLAAMPPVTYGDFRSAPVIVAGVGLLVTSFLLIKRFAGALVVGILFSTLVALALGVTSLPRENYSWPDFSTLFQADVTGALQPKFLPLLLALIMVDFFDTIGTVTAISEQAHLVDKKGRVPHLRTILGVDSLSAAVGGLFGASSVTAYIESAAGVAEGARTGLHTVFVGLFFLLAVFLAPFAAIVPGSATAPALILVGFLMCAQLKQIDFDNLTTAIPAFLTVLTIPLTFSIAHGIGNGFLSYVALKVLGGQARDVHPVMYGTAAVFLAYFVWG